MNNTIKYIIKKIFPLKLLKSLKEKNILYQWEKQGKPIPPPHIIKEKTVIKYAKKFSITTLIETGTYYGDMIWAVKDLFKTIISIEIDKKLYQKAKKQFSSFNHISIMQGDSSKILNKILSNVNRPCIFWLDGHTSPGTLPPENVLSCPIKEELLCIFKHHINDHIILIDDAHDFTGKYGYPSFQELSTFIKKHKSNYTFQKKDNIIRIHKEF